MWKLFSKLDASKADAHDLKILFLGGLDAIGKNMSAIIYGDEILIVDAGLMFPDEDMFGIDRIIPNFDYLVEHKANIKGIVITHGHEDHIGAIGDLLAEIQVPVYGTALTLGLIESHLRESIVSNAELKIVQYGDRIDLGCFNVEFICVSHSIPDGAALAIRTPGGMIVHSGDFKVDFTPVSQMVIDLVRFAELGKEGVLLFLSDSTNAIRSGYTRSERMVSESFERIFRQVEGRIIIATFASNVYRVQQAIDMAVKFKRKVIFAGKSMEEVSKKAYQLGYLKYPDDIVEPMGRSDKIRDDQCVIITTGSQGEPMAALTKMSMDSHKVVQLKQGDTVIISALPIPGNEKAVYRTIDNLSRKGIHVIYEEDSKVHVSGHGCQEEQKLLLSLVKPTHFIPIHGEYRHLQAHAGLAREMGVQSVYIAENGDLLKLTPEAIELEQKMQQDSVLIDGLGRVDSEHNVIGDRRALSEDGVIAVMVTMDENGYLTKNMDIQCKGFIFQEDPELLLESTKESVCASYNHMVESNTVKPQQSRERIRELVQKYLYRKTKRRPTLLLFVHKQRDDE